MYCWCGFLEICHAFGVERICPDAAMNFSFWTSFEDVPHMPDKVFFGEWRPWTLHLYRSWNGYRYPRFPNSLRTLVLGFLTLHSTSTRDYTGAFLRSFSQRFMRERQLMFSPLGTLGCSRADTKCLCNLTVLISHWQNAMYIPGVSKYLRK